MLGGKIRNNLKCEKTDSHWLISQCKSSTKVNIANKQTDESCLFLQAHQGFLKSLKLRLVIYVAFLYMWIQTDYLHDNNNKKTSCRANLTVSIIGLDF